MIIINLTGVNEPLKSLENIVIETFLIQQEGAKRYLKAVNN